MGVELNNLPATELDGIVFQLDANGLTDGALGLANNTGSLTTSSLAAYTSLTDVKSWTIDVEAPTSSDNEPPVVGVLNTPTNVGLSSLNLDWTAATDNVGVTGYQVYKDGVVEATLGNVLTYNVTGLTSGTTYDFYITALDEVGNESSPSNTQNVTTQLNALTITIETVSTSPAWKPTRVYNNGLPLRWKVDGGVTIAEQSYSGNTVPTFNLSSNTGTAIITITSDDDFVGVTQLDVRGKNITSMDVANATELTRLIAFTNALTSIDVGSNTKLTSLRVQSNDLSSIDVNSNTLLTELTLSNNNLTSLNISNNPLILSINSPS